jgi:hypothetical protein
VVVACALALALAYGGSGIADIELASSGHGVD